MKGFAIFLLIVVIGGALWWYKPWEPKRYDDTPKGQEARKIDKKVDVAVNWPNVWEARDMLKQQPADKFTGEKQLVFGDYTEWSRMIDSLYSAGATNVSFAYIHRGVRSGDRAEGLFVTLPQDPAKRQTLISLAQNWQHPPKEVNQKYIYHRIMGWDVNDADKSFMGD